MNEKGALVLIEFQPEWLGKDGKLYSLMKDRKQFIAALEGAKRAVEIARQSDVLMVH